MSLATLTQALLNGDRRALARLMSIVEDNGRDAEEASALVFPHTGRAHVIGVTGAPGVGKSTLVNALTKAYRARGRTIGIVAIDPTSPFSGGAILGDRVRMGDLANDSGVFIRSMASRGSLGGLAAATMDAVKLLDAAGYDKVLIETVGAGQSETEIAGAAHTVVVVVMPGFGDDIQATKAGILEIADLFVVNKADTEGADSAAMALEMMLQLSVSEALTPKPGVALEATSRPASESGIATWKPVVRKASALKEQGVHDVINAIEDHLVFLRASGHMEIRERLRIVTELENRLRCRLMERMLNRLERSEVSAVIDRIVRRELDPHRAVRRLLEGVSMELSSAQRSILDNS